MEGHAPAPDVLPSIAGTRAGVAGVSAAPSAISAAEDRSTSRQADSLTTQSSSSASAAAAPPPPTMSSLTKSLTAQPTVRSSLPSPHPLLSDDYHSQPSTSNSVERSGTYTYSEHGRAAVYGGFHGDDIDEHTHLEGSTSASSSSRFEHEDADSGDTENPEVNVGNSSSFASLWWLSKWHSQHSFETPSLFSLSTLFDLTFAFAILTTAVAALSSDGAMKGANSGQSPVSSSLSVYLCDAIIIWFHWMILQCKCGVDGIPSKLIGMLVCTFNVLLSMQMLCSDSKLDLIETFFSVNPAKSNTLAQESSSALFFSLYSPTALDCILCLRVLLAIFCWTASVQVRVGKYVCRMFAVYHSCMALSNVAIFVVALIHWQLTASGRTVFSLSDAFFDRFFIGFLVLDGAFFAFLPFFISPQSIFPMSHQRSKLVFSYVKRISQIVYFTFSAAILFILLDTFSSSSTGKPPMDSLSSLGCLVFAVFVLLVLCMLWMHVDDAFFPLISPTSRLGQFFLSQANRSESDDAEQLTYQQHHTAPTYFPTILPVSSARPHALQRGRVVALGYLASVCLVILSIALLCASFIHIFRGSFFSESFTEDRFSALWRSLQNGSLLQLSANAAIFFLLHGRKDRMLFRCVDCSLRMISLGASEINLHSLLSFVYYALAVIHSAIILYVNFDQTLPQMQQQHQKQGKADSGQNTAVEGAAVAEVHAQLLLYLGVLLGFLIFLLILFVLYHAALRYFHEAHFRFHRFVIHDDDDDDVDEEDDEHFLLRKRWSANAHISANASGDYSQQALSAAQSTENLQAYGAMAQHSRQPAPRWHDGMDDVNHSSGLVTFNSRPVYSAIQFQPQQPLHTATALLSPPPVSAQLISDPSYSFNSPQEIPQYIRQAWNERQMQMPAQSPNSAASTAKSPAGKNAEQYLLSPSTGTSIRAISQDNGVEDADEDSAIGDESPGSPEQSLTMEQSPLQSTTDAATAAPHTILGSQTPSSNQTNSSGAPTLPDSRATTHSGPPTSAWIQPAHAASSAAAALAQAPAPAPASAFGALPMSAQSSGSSAVSGIGSASGVVPATRSLGLVGQNWPRVPPPSHVQSSYSVVLRGFNEELKREERRNFESRMHAHDEAEFQQPHGQSQRRWQRWNQPMAASLSASSAASGTSRQPQRSQPQQQQHQQLPSNSSQSQPRFTYAQQPSLQRQQQYVSSAGLRSSQPHSQSRLRSSAAGGRASSYSEEDDLYDQLQAALQAGGSDRRRNYPQARR